jgi:uncharacterized phosphosugar-binding protein
MGLERNLSIYCCQSRRYDSHSLRFGSKPPVSVDIALAAKERGLTTIGLTNMTYSSKVSSRHSSRKNLYEVVDIVIDNCGDFEDSSMLLEGMDQKIGPTSTAIGALIVNAIVIATVDNLIKAGITPLSSIVPMLMVEMNLIKKF